MNFKIGQKVVCLRDGWMNRDRWSAYPIAGQVYTVRGFSLKPWSVAPIALDLVEIVNPEFNFSESGPGEPAWDQREFRPVVEPKIELPECLTALLDPAKHKKLEPIAVRVASVA